IEISQLWATSVLYGLYVALFGGSIYVLVYKRPNAYHMGSSVALFLLTTAYMGISLARILAEPTVTSNSSIADGNTAVPCVPGTSERLHEATLGNLFSAILIVLTSCTNFIADGVLIYRCVVLWPRRLGHCIGILLGLLLLAETATGIAESYYEVQFYFLERQQTPQSEGTLPPKWIELSNILDSFGTSNTILTLVVNILAMIFIASRIWSMARQLEKTLGRGAGVRYRAAMSMIIESGSLISATQLIVTYINFIDSVLIYSVRHDLFGDLLQRSPAVLFQGLIGDIGQMLLVIAPTLIIVRVGMGQGFDSVMETMHEHRASQGVRETQVKSIRFAEHRSTTTGISNLASIDAIIPDKAPVSDGDTHTVDSGSEYSNVSGHAEGQEGEKTSEVALSIV
ncbi:hypothetical protein EVG20_g5467, partial [Dentipellis fragilis]